MASLYEVLYNQLRQEGYSPGFDSGEGGGYTQEQWRPITLQDGRQASYNPATGQIQVAGNRRAEGAGEVYDLENYNQDGTTSRETTPYKANDWKNSLMGALAVSLPFLAPTIAASYGVIGAAPGLAAGGMDAAGLDALIAQQSAMHTAPTMAGVAASEFALPGGALSDIASAPAAAGAATYGGPTSLAQLGGVAGAGAVAAGAGEMAGTPGIDVAPTDPQPTAVPGSNPVLTPGTQSSNNPNQSILERLMSGQMGANDWMSLLSGALGARNQYNFGQDLLDRANQATPNRGFYEGALRQSYENPGSYLSGPDATAAFDVTHNRLQRNDAAKGQLSNSFGREVQLNNQMMGNLDKYRTGLAGIVGQQANTYSAQNSTAAAGMAANNSWSNGLLYPLLQQPARG